MWMTPDRVMFGTKNGMLHIVENGEIKQAFSYNALQIQEINMSKIDELVFHIIK